MKNVSIHDSRGEEIAHFINFPNGKKDQENLLREKFGSGKFRISYRLAKKFTDKKGRVQNGLPRQFTLWVTDESDSTMVYAGLPQAPKFLQKQEVDQMAAIKNMIEEKFKEIEERFEEEEDEEEEDEDPSGDIKAKIGGLISRPEYSKLFSGILTGDPDKISASFKETSAQNPEIIRALIVDAIQIFLV